MKGYAIVMFFCCLASATNSFQSSARKKWPQADGFAFWQYVSKAYPYTKWQMWPNNEGIYQGKSPHGDLVKFYANQQALDSLKAKKPLPYGAILVRENYTKDKKNPVAITSRYRVKGFDPQNGDWFWAKYTPQGGIIAAGKIQECIDCHGTMKSIHLGSIKPLP